MGTYYQYANYDKKEVISLHYVTNIKQGAFSAWSLQTAVLNTFLGFKWPGYSINCGKAWEGRWAKDRVCIESDATDNESDDWESNDAGMLFIIDLEKRGQLDKFLEITNLQSAHANIRQDIETWKR